MAQSSPMNGGDGKYSYTKNSTLQRNAASIVKDAMKETVMDNLDVEELLLMRSSTTFTIADFGCSVGPNTFIAMQTMIETVEQKWHEQQHLLQNSKKLEFQVMLNDQTGNDFNTLFASLPHRRNYFAAGVPGSFYGRLFPSSSIHFAYSSYALHWLSKLPEELQVKDSPAWNAGRIHYMGAPAAVVKAYADQFEADMEAFLRARAEEIVAGGMIVILMPSDHQGWIEAAQTNNALTLFLESILIDMVKEGVVEQEKVDSFNLPLAYPSVQDVRSVVEKNGCFKIVRMELRDVEWPKKGDGMVDIERLLAIYRAATEGIYANHFGNEIVDQFFTRAILHKLNWTHNFQSYGFNSYAQLFLALKRK